MKPHEKARTIRYEILKGYFFLTGMIVLIVAASILCLYFARNGYGRATECLQQQYEAQKVITAHYKWLEQLSAAITSGDVFEGSLDPNTCALGKWINSGGEGITEDPQIASALSAITAPHQGLHLRAEELIWQSQGDKNAVSSEQTAAATKEMNASKEFIRIAEKNYLEAAAKGRTPKSLPDRTESEAV